MTKLCPRGKAAAKRKFKVYPSAYANAYASRICAGKIKDPSGVKRKDFRGRKPAAMGGKMSQSEIDFIKKMSGAQVSDKELESLRKSFKKKRRLQELKKELDMKTGGRAMRAGGGLMEATARLKRQGLRGGGISSRGLGRAFMKGGRV
jgi:hypothetical protein